MQRFELKFGSLSIVSIEPGFQCVTRTRLAVCHQKLIVISEKCDIGTLTMPENAERWQCDKLMLKTKVRKNTKCEIICLKGHDFSKGKQS